MSETDQQWPTEIRLLEQGTKLRISFDNGEIFEIQAELLRVRSPSAEVQGHSPAERKVVPGKRRVSIKGVEPIGNYAIKLTFDDGHDTGLYTWAYLHDMGCRQDELLATYLNELASKGMSRDRAL